MKCIYGAVTIARIELEMGIMLSFNMAIKMAMNIIITTDLRNGMR